MTNSIVVQSDSDTKQSDQKKLTSSLRLEVFEMIQSLIVAGLGLVAALAWNDAIQSLFAAIFGKQSSLIAKFLYALLVTILVVYLTVRTSRFINRLRNADDKNTV